MKKTLIQSIYIVILLILLISCGEGSTPTIFQGTIVDGATMQPVEGVKINAVGEEPIFLFGGGGYSGVEREATTIEDGSFLLKIERMSNTGSYIVKISKSNFCTVFSISVGSHQTNIYDTIRMYRWSLVNVNVTIKEGTDSLIIGLKGLFPGLYVDPSVVVSLFSNNCQSFYNGSVNPVKCDQDYVCGFFDLDSYGEGRESFCIDCLHNNKILRDIIDWSWSDLTINDNVNFSFYVFRGIHYTLEYKTYDENNELQRTDSANYLINKDEFDINLNL